MTRRMRLLTLGVWAFGGLLACVSARSDVAGRSRRRRVAALLVSAGLAVLFGVACGGKSRTAEAQDELAPLPEECAALASKLGACFHSPKVEESTRAGFPKLKRRDVDENERLRTTCAQNLHDLKADCR
jgi:hypothetical protein